MKKKVLALAVVIAMLAIAVVSSTMAYFTDDEFNRNVVTVGDIDVKQDEEFDPTTIPEPGEDVTKKVTVSNVGDGDAYIRTLVAVEATNGIDSLINLTFADNDAWDDNVLLIKVSGDNYDDTVFAVGYYNYAKAGLTNSILEKDVKDVVSLENFQISTAADNTFVANVGEELEILVLTQAVQTGSFKNVDEAFEATFGFGEITADTITDDEKAAVADAFGAYLGDGYTVVDVETRTLERPTEVSVDEPGEVK